MQGSLPPPAPIVPPAPVIPPAPMVVVVPVDAAFAPLPVLAFAPPLPARVVTEPSLDAVEPPAPEDENSLPQQARTESTVSSSNPRRGLCPIEAAYVVRVAVVQVTSIATANARRASSSCPRTRKRKGC